MGLGRAHSAADFQLAAGRAIGASRSKRRLRAFLWAAALVALAAARCPAQVVINEVVAAFVATIGSQPKIKSAIAIPTLVVWIDSRLLAI